MDKKLKSVWFCSSCGNESPKWMGRCPACGEWNTMVEEPKGSRTDKGSAGSEVARERALLGIGMSLPMTLDAISIEDEQRLHLGNDEVDRLLGGGIVKGSMILIGGEPGIGKSTLSLQIPLHRPDLHTLYVSGEESPRQIKLRADRLLSRPRNAPICGQTAAQTPSRPRNALICGQTDPICGRETAPASDTHIFCETLLENILEQARALKPDLMIVDSIQTIYTERIESSAGSVSQVKECAAALLRFAKESGTPVILIGHITKDGSIAGPKVLEHIVDVVLQFEGDTRHSYRILRSIKNRFGSTAELAIFEMTDCGLREVTNPSEILTPMHQENLSGVAVGATLDGTRPFLIETQALVSTAAYGMPQRSATGYDSRRLNMLLAVLEKRAGFKLSAKDVFLNIAGGIKISDPACDLAVIASILSSNFDLSISLKTCFAAEVGLSGEIRPVSQIERRIAEARRLGYKTIYISAFNLPDDYKRLTGIDIIEVPDIPALCRSLFRTA